MVRWFSIVVVLVVLLLIIAISIFLFERAKALIAKQELESARAMTCRDIAEKELCDKKSWLRAARYPVIAFNANKDEDGKLNECEIELKKDFDDKEYEVCKADGDTLEQLCKKYYDCGLPPKNVKEENWNKWAKCCLEEVCGCE
jgi:hypothetical protein